MITDIVGFSSISRRSEDLAMKVLGDHDSLLRPLFDRFGGTVVKTMGDSFLVEFPTVVGAVECSYEAQKGIHGHNGDAPEDRRFDVRIGVHIGDVIHVENDVFGDGVNVAARLEPLAGPGGICLSRQVFDLVQNKVSMPLVSEGKHRLKNIDGQVEVFRVLMPWQEDTWQPPALDSGSGDTPSIAVLPFVDLSQERDQEYFCDGMTEELIDALSRVDALKVVARSSAFAFKGRSVDVREVGRRLDVATVLEGSVRKAGPRVRVTVQLVGADNGYHFWSERYDRTLDDVFGVQEQISLAIVDKLRIRLLGKDRERLTRQHTDDVEAHSLYLEGRFFWNQRKAESLQKAMALFTRAIEKDPNYALPYVGIADCYSMLGTYGFMAPGDAFPQARMAAQRALDLSDDIGEAHATLGWTYAIHDYNWATAERALERALELSPSYASAHSWLSMVKLAQGQGDEAVERAERSLQLDPLSLTINGNLGLVMACVGRVDDAIEQLTRTLGFERRFPLTYQWLGTAYFMKGDYEAAIGAYTDGMQMGGMTPFSACHLAAVLAVSGRRDQAAQALERLSSGERGGYRSPYCMAVARLGMGDTEGSLDLLEQAREERDTMVIFVQSLLLLPGLREQVADNPRFHQFLSSIGLAA